MFWVMAVSGGDLQLKAADQWLRDIPTDAPRGRILDKNGNVLAATSTRYNLYVRPGDADDKPALAALLAQIFGYDHDSILQKISKKTSEVTVATRATKEQLNAVFASGLRGVYYAEDNFRYYPYGDFMTQALGFCSSDGFGQTGLEAYYDKYLTGVNGRIMTQTDLIGRALGGSYYQPAVEGLDIVTGLDGGIQRIVEGALKEAVAKFDPKRAACIVMDYNSGEIAALAEYPSFDLNDVPRDDLEKLFSTSKSTLISSVYEPGSTFKILTAAAALDAGAISTSTRFYCPGFHIVDGQRIRCWKAKGHGSIDFAQGVAGSCNVAFMESAMRLGTDKFYGYLRDFGLMNRTGVDMTGETSGLFIPQNDVKTVDLARIGFGQAVAVTPIGIISATSAAVNGGTRITPHLLTDVKDRQGNSVLAPALSVEGTRVIKRETSETLRALLTSVVTEGSGKSAYVPGYTIAGKTGTAQKYENGNIASGKYISSFLGFSLTEGAEYAVLLIVDEPKGYMYYGSLVAAPLVGGIFASVFDYLGVAPTYTGEEAKIVGEPFALPDFCGLGVSEARLELAKLGLYCETDGDGDKVTGQYPAAGATVDKRNAVLLLT